MAWKDILVQIDDSDASMVRLKVALAIAKAHDAHLTGLCVQTFPSALAVADDTMDPTLFQTMSDEIHRRCLVAEKAFRAATRNRVTPCEWRLVEGGIVDVFSRHGRYADLVVLGQDDPTATFGLDRQGLPDDVILNVGRPVLIIPREGSFTSIGKSPLVAWNGSHVAARAVHDAMPLLEKAKRADVIDIESEPTPGNKVSPETLSIADHLARHGIKTTVASIKTDAESDGKALLATAKRRGADLIVMGAYGDWRLKQMIMGGVTSHVLSQTTLPILMSH